VPLTKVACRRCRRGVDSLPAMHPLRHGFRTRTRFLAGFVALATVTLVVAAPGPAVAAQSTCPTFQVLHNDRIGKLRLRAGDYTIRIGNQRRLSCESASDLFRQFLEDYDGTLPDGWRVQARRSRFIQRSSGDAFTVTRTRDGGGGTGGGGGGGGSGTGGGGSGQHPATGRACPAPFTVQNNDRIGELKLPAGKYRITLLAIGRLSCQRASSIFARFLQDYTGDLPGAWRLDPKTATFSKSTHYGFRVKPYR